MKTIFIESITVRRGLVSALVRTAPGCDRTDSAPEFAPRLLGILPGLRSHPCVSPGETFANEVAATQTAHVLEHVALEIVSAVVPGRTLVGHTAWNARVYGPGVCRVTVQSVDDLTGVGALAIAAELVDWAWSGLDTAPDVAAACSALAEKRESRLRLTSSIAPSSGVSMK